MNLPFTPRFTPLPYQADYLAQHGHKEAWGLIWDPGTGKTKAIIDNVVMLMLEDRVDGALILAPNGVHREWALTELLKHWPHPPVFPYDAWTWDTDRSSGINYQKDFKRWLEYTRSHKNPLSPHIPFLLMSYDSLMTDHGKQASWDFLRSRRVFYVGDESQRFKTPAAKRQVRVFHSSAYAAYKRIASGTPMDKPFDIYSQMRFLDEDFWRKTLGIDSIAAFRHHFGNWHLAKFNTGVTKEVLNDNNPYKNLEQLEAVLKTMTTRLTEEQACLNLPPRQYMRIYHDLTPEQRQAYEELKEDCMTILSSGDLVTADHVLTMRLRLLQIGAGFVTPSAGAEPVPFAVNPRLDRVNALLRSPKLSDEPTLQWCQFIHDAKQLAAASEAAGRTPVIYDSNDPENTLDAWKAGDADDLIANLGSGLSEGHTLVRTAHIFYYSNSPRLITRQQSEKRTHRIGQLRSPTYYDFLARGTNDEANLEYVRRKAAYTGEVFGEDPARAARWLKATLTEGEHPEVQPEEPASRQGDFWDGGVSDEDMRAYEEMVR